MGKKPNNNKFKFDPWGQKTSSHMAEWSHPCVEELTTAHSWQVSQPSQLASFVIQCSYCSTCNRMCNVQKRILSSLKRVMCTFFNSTSGNVSTSQIFLCSSILPAQSREVKAVFQTSLLADKAGRNAQPGMILVQIPRRPQEDWTLDKELPLIPAVPVGSTAGFSCHCVTRAGCRPLQPLIAHAELSQNL